MAAPRSGASCLPWDDLVLLCDVADRPALERYIAHKYFLGPFSYLVKNFIEPERTKALLTGGLPRRSPGFGAVRRRMHHGASGGRGWYSDPEPNTTHWVSVDYHAYFLQTARVYATKRVGGIFFRKQFDDESDEANDRAVDERLWELLKRMKYDLLASRRNSIGERIFLRARANVEGDEDVPEESGLPAPQTEEERETRLTSLVENMRERNDAEEQGVVPQQSGEDSEQTLGGDGVVNTAHAEDGDAAMRRMVDEATSGPLDLNDRRGQWNMLLLVCEKSTDAGEVQVLSTMFNNNDDQNNAQTAQWLREITQAYSKVELSSERTSQRAVEYTEVEAILDNHSLQSFDLAGAMTRLGATNALNIQLPGMAVSSKLSAFQLTGIDRIITIWQQHRVAILNDVVGVGKTWQALGCALRLITGGEENGHTEEMPTLIVVPRAVLKQWLDTIELVSERFVVKVYHDSGDIDDPRYIRKVIDCNHDIFAPHPTRYRTILLTTHGRITKRHGPAAQASWRQKKLKWSKARATASGVFHHLDDNFPASLRRCFGFVFVDECQVLKNYEAQINITMQWMDAQRYLLISATLLLAGPRDFAGYLAMEQKLGTNLAKASRLTRLGVWPDTNPYDLPDDHPGAALRFAPLMFKRFICDNEDRDQAAVYLAKLYPALVIRRTYASRLPADAPTTLGDSLPRVSYSYKRCAFGKASGARYSRFAAQKLPKLVRFNKQTGRLMWSFSILRELILAGDWVHFAHIAGEITTKSRDSLIKNRRCLLQWLKEVKAADSDAAFELPSNGDDVVGMAAALLDGDPKLRELLRDVAELVVKRQRKVLIWVDYVPAQVKIFHLLKMFKIDTAIYHAGLRVEAAEQLQQRFTTRPDQCHVLILAYKVGSVGLNLQSLCYTALLYDTPLNDAAREQCIGRVRRFGSRAACVDVVEYGVPGTLSDKLEIRALMHSIPGLFAELNANHVGLSAGDGDGISEITIGNYVVYEGRLYDANDAAVRDLGLPAPSAREFIQHLRLPALADVMDIEDE